MGSNTTDTSATLVSVVVPAATVVQEMSASLFGDIFEKILGPAIFPNVLEPERLLITQRMNIVFSWLISLAFALPVALAAIPSVTGSQQRVFASVGIIVQSGINILLALRASNKSAGELKGALHNAGTTSSIADAIEKEPV